MPSNQTSGHVCAFCPRTTYTPSVSSPGVKPTATRAGSPTERAKRGVRAGELLAVAAPVLEEAADRFLVVSGARR